MAYNDDPKVRESEKYAKKFGFDQVIVIGIDYTGDRLSGVSYGKNKQLCDAAEPLMRSAYDAIYTELASNGIIL